MRNEQPSISIKIGTSGFYLAFTLMILKVANIVPMPWWIVTMPIWLPFSIIFIIVFITVY